MLISNSFGLENLYRPLRNRNSWRVIRPLRQQVIDCDKALVNTVSMKAVAEERQGERDSSSRLGGFIQVFGLTRWLIIGLGKNLVFLVSIRRRGGS